MAKREQDDWDKVVANLPKGSQDFWDHLEAKVDKQMRDGQVKSRANGLLAWLGWTIFLLGLGVLFSGMGMFGPAPAPLTGVLDNPIIGCTAGPALMILGGIIMKLSIRS